MRNEVTIEGRLAEEPSASVTPAGEPICCGKIAFAQPNGKAGFAPIVAFGSVAERLATFQKATALRITGHLGFTTWVSRDGVALEKLQIVASDLEIITLPAGIIKWQTGRAAADPNAPDYRPVFGKHQNPKGARVLIPEGRTGGTR